MRQLYAALQHASAERQRNEPPTTPAAPEVLLPERFTYFDCTDYRDQWTDYSDGGDPIKPERPLLTFALWRKRYHAKAKLRWYSHLHLLIAYVFNPQNPNVHGGYFQGLLSQQLIYRLACLGYADTIRAYEGEARMTALCREKQIRVLISPELQGVRNSVSV